MYRTTQKLWAFILLASLGFSTTFAQDAMRNSESLQKKKEMQIQSPPANLPQAFKEIVRQKQEASNLHWDQSAVQGSLKKLKNQTKNTQAINAEGKGVVYVCSTDDENIELGTATFNFSSPETLTHKQDKIGTLLNNLWGLDFNEEGIGYGFSYLGTVFKIYSDGLYEEIEADDASENYLSSVAYDVTRKVWYASSTGGLFKFYPETGSSEIVAYYDFSAYDEMYSLAFDNEGSLYGFATESGTLVSIDTATASVTTIGVVDDAGFKWKQDLAYDRDNDALYLAGWSDSDASCFYSIDIETGAGTLLGSFEGNSYITAFAIPFSSVKAGAPGIVSNTSFTADETGELSAELRFTTPDTTYAGETLTSIDSLKVYLNRSLYKTYTEVTVATEYVLTLNVEELGEASVEIVSYNEVGKSEKLSLSTWVGQDLPVGPGNVLLTAEKDGAYLSWSKPEAGINGGYFNGNVASYQVVRSDNKVFELDGETTSFKDASVSMGLYRYTVTPITALGEGGSTHSNVEALYIDEYLLYEPFNSDLKSIGWTYDDNWNVSYSTIYAGGPAPEAYFLWGTDEETQRLISPELNTSGLSSATLNFDHYLDNFRGGYTLKVQTSSDGGTSWNDVWSFDVDTLTADFGPELKSLTIDNDDMGSAQFQLAFVFDGPFNHINFWVIDNVELKVPNVNDVRPVQLYVSDNVLANKALSYSADVQNVGTTGATFDVTMQVSEDGNVVFTSSKTLTLDASVKSEVVFDKWTPGVGRYEVAVYTSLDGDELMDNDTMFMAVDGLAIDNPVYSYNYGGESFAPQGLAIFDKYDTTKYVLTTIGRDLFTSVVDLKSDKDGNILVTDYYRIGSIDTSDYSYEIKKTISGVYSCIWSSQLSTYFATDALNLFTLDPETMDTTIIGSNWATTLYITSLEFDDKGRLWGIDFSNNYLSLIDPTTGKASSSESIAISDLLLDISDRLSFDTETSTMYYISEPYQTVYRVDLETGDFTYVRSLSDNEADICTWVVPNPPLEYVSLSGIVTNSKDETPVADANISLIRNIAGYDITLSSITDDNGAYAFPNVLKDTFQVQILATNYNEFVDTVDLSLVDEALVQNFVIDKAENSVTFKVFSYDGSALEGAIVTMYNVKDTTDANGEAVYNYIPKGEYPYSIVAAGHGNYFNTLSVDATDLVVKVVLEQDDRVERNYLVAEDFTGTWCTYCPGAQMGIHDLREEGYNIAAMAVHYGDIYQTTETYNRMVFYEVESFPTINFDGGFDDYSYLGGSTYSSLAETYKPIIDDRIVEKTPLAVDITAGSFNTETRVYSGTATLKAAMTVSENQLTFVAALTESDIDAEWSYGTLTTVEDVVREYYPDYDGETFTISAGETLTFNFEFTLDAAWVEGNSEIIVFAQDLETNEIYNADMAAVTESIGTSITTKNLQDAVSIYPNPVQTVLKIASRTDLQEISIYNFLGKKILQISNPEDLESLSIENFARGVYFVECVAFDNSKLVTKIIKQ